ncbi:hypothetical protein QYF36_018966 [Acer negundo]|nr:hypothetical protein QYF36_018966 [Acer negundo]
MGKRIKKAQTLQRQAYSELTKLATRGRLGGKVWYNAHFVPFSWVRRATFSPHVGAMVRVYSVYVANGRLTPQGDAISGLLCSFCSFESSVVRRPYHASDTLICVIVLEVLLCYSLEDESPVMISFLGFSFSWSG